MHTAIASTHDPAPIRPPTSTHSTDALSEGLLRDICEGLAAAEDLWRPHVHHDTETRRPVRLLAADSWEAWVIGWTTGQRVELHDHGRSAGALAVVEGDLIDVRLRAGHLVHHTRRQGSVTDLPAGIIHDIAALGQAPATSIHVYAPTMRAMTFYTGDGTALRTTPVPDEPPVADLRQSARALHPSATRG